ncbi:MAG: hypothetical protein FJ144_07810 [Deltaproteobacteria bacterium]|nr:hypothetical protein [Deltaproteobacteria bacterium]
MAGRVLHLVSHGPHCLDGAVAAAAVARFFEDDDVRVQFASNQEVGALIRSIEPAPGEELWITDISWNDPDTEAHLARLAERGVVLRWFDHHRTAIERLAAGAYALPFATQVVRDEFSAAKLVYDHLAESAAEAKRRGEPGAPARFEQFAPVAAMADDNDRWLHRIPGSRELGLVVRALPTGAAYEAFLEMGPDLADTPAMAEARKRVKEELERNRALSVATRFDRSIGSLTLTSALCDGYSGEIADEWGKASPRTVFVLFDVRSRALSFRRSPDIDFDLSKLAEACGGGGHPAASGASLPSLPAALGELVGDQVEAAARKLTGEPSK